jgi:hypothetical protein
MVLSLSVMIRRNEDAPWVDRCLAREPSAQPLAAPWFWADWSRHWNDRR